MPLDEFLGARERGVAGLVAGVQFSKPQNAADFRFRKVSRVKPKGIAVMTHRRPPAQCRRTDQPARIAYGAMAPTAVRARAVERALEGQDARCNEHSGCEGRRARRHPPRHRCHRQRMVSPRGLAGASRAALDRRRTLRKHAWQKFPSSFASMVRTAPRSSTPPTTCSMTLRRGLDEFAPKYGCGQGTCGVCTVLIDGEPQLSCLTLGGGLRGPPRGNGCRPGGGAEPAPAAGRVHGEFRGAMRLLHARHADGGARRCSTAIRSRAGRRWSRRSPATSAAAPATSRSSTPFSPRPARRPETRLRENEMLEIRKDYLRRRARRQSQRRSARAFSARTCSGHVTGRSPYFDDHAFEGLLHLKVVRSPHHHARIRRIDIGAAERAPGVERILRAADVPREQEHAAQPDQFRQGRRAVAGGRQGALQGRAGRRRHRRERAQAAMAARKWCGSTTKSLPAVFDVEEALKPGAPVVNETYPNNYFELSRQVRSSEAALRRRRGGLRRRRPRDRGALPDVADRACADRDQRLDRRARAPTTASSCYSSTQALFFSLDTCGQDPRRASRTGCISSAAPSAAASAARSIRSPSRSRSSARC